MWPPGYFPSEGLLCYDGEPPLPGILDEGVRCVRLVVGLCHGWNPVGEPPVQPHGRGRKKGGTGWLHHLIIAQEWPGPQYPWWYAQGALSGGSSHRTGQSASVGHGPDARPQVAEIGLLTGLSEGTQAQMPHRPLPRPTM